MNCTICGRELTTGDGSDGLCFACRMRGAMEDDNERLASLAEAIDVALRLAAAEARAKTANAGGEGRP